MEDTGGKSGRRPGRHLQVEASGPGNATTMQQRLAGRCERGTEVEGCTGGAEGRSKKLLSLRVTWMEDTGGKSGRRPGCHLQVEASGPGNARPAHWRLAGRSRRGEVVEGCAGGAEGRSKRLICLRRTWMEDTGGKSGRRPGRHLQVEASGPGNARPAHWRLAGRFRRGEVVEGCAGGAEGRSKGLICLLGTWMEDAGGKSGRRPGSHLQVEASGPGNARPAHWRLAGRSRRGEVVEGCAGGAAGRSKGLICLRVT